MPGATWSPHFTVMNRAGTYWYHPHGIGLTAYQVTMGLAGMIIVRDSAEAALPLPRTYGVDDIPLVLQTKPVVDGQLMMHTGLDSVVIANGARNAWKELPAQVVRLRCLNGADERSFMLGLSNGGTFQVIGTGGGLLDAPVALQRVRLMPGERVELLLDLTGMEGSTFQLMSYSSELPTGILGSPMVGDGDPLLDGYGQNALNGGDFPFVTFTVGPPTADPITAIPATLLPVNPLSEADADTTRNFTFAPLVNSGEMSMIEGPFGINGAMMDMGVINEVVPLGNTEIWSITNNTEVAHPFHIHDVEFNILDRNGAPPDAWEHGWKDVVYVPPMGQVRVIMRFEDFADPTVPYMYHCHMLMHEDEGMMGQFTVVDPSGIREHTDLQPRVWPQPASDVIQVQWPRAGAFRQAVLADATGRNVATQQLRPATSSARLAVGDVPPGAYLLILTGPNVPRSVQHVIIAR
jgi:bilirubin oxidase